MFFLLHSFIEILNHFKSIFGHCSHFIPPENIRNPNGNIGQNLVNLHFFNTLCSKCQPQYLVPNNLIRFLEIIYIVLLKF